MSLDPRSPRGNPALCVRRWLVWRVRARQVRLVGCYVRLLDAIDSRDLFALVPELRRCGFGVRFRSIGVATVLRKVCGVTQSSPVSSRAARHCRRTLCGVSQVPVRDGNTASYSLILMLARRRSSTSTANFSPNGSGRASTAGSATSGSSPGHCAPASSSRADARRPQGGVGVEPDPRPGGLRNQRPTGQQPPHHHTSAVSCPRHRGCGWVALDLGDGP